MAEESVLSRFIKGTISIAFGNMSLLTLGLVGTMVATRRMPEEEYGVFVLFQVIAMFLMQISSFGLDLALAKFMAGAETDEERRRLFNTAWWWRFMIIPIASLLAFVARPLLTSLFGELLLEAFIFVPVLFFFDSMIKLLKAALQGYFRFRDIGIVDILSSVLNFGLIILFVLVMDMGLMGLIYSRIISIGAAFSYAFLRLPAQKRFEIDRSLLFQMLRFGTPLLANDILSFVYTRIDTLVIGALLGPAEIAYYEIARRIPDSLQRLYESFRSVYFPFISKFLDTNEYRKAARLLNTSSRYMAFASLLAAVGVMAFGADFLQLLFSDRYLASAPAFTVLMMTMGVSFVGNILGTTLVAQGETEKPAIINTVHSAVSVAGSLLFIPMFGIVGAAFAGLAGNLISNPLNLFFVRRGKLDARLWEYGKPLLIGFGVWAIYALVSPTSFLVRTAFVALYVVVCALTGVLNLSDLAILGDSDLPMSSRVRSLLSRFSQA